MMNHTIRAWEEVGVMRRRLGLKLHPDRVAFDAACKAAGEAFREQRYRDALAIYETFAAEHPTALEEEVQLRIRALKGYIAEHVEKAGRFSAHIAD